MNNLWQAEAPANIALIKYMGKLPGNIATNPSLSFSNINFKTEVRLELSCEDKKDIWVPWEDSGDLLSEKESDRFLQHLGFIKNHYNFNGFFIVRSRNNFPSGCGLASSASSFAALTMAAAQAISSLKQTPAPPVKELASLSRHGSGSSCRSFFMPWGFWDGVDSGPVSFPGIEINHFVVTVSSSKKDISSTEAHKTVRTSDLFIGREIRAEKRLKELRSSMSTADWRLCYNLVWADFWDMHALFETSNPSFGYISDDSMFVLRVVRSYWEKHNDGPLVTMDAGPNVHLLFRRDQTRHQNELLNFFREKYLVLG